MQKTAKKFLAMLLAVVLALSMLPTAVFATESSDSGLMSIVPYGANDQTTGTATITAQDPVTFTGYATFEDVSHYHVTVPVGTTYVKATYKGVALQTNSATGEVSGYYADLPQWTGSGLQVAYTESNDEITVTIPLSYTMEGEDGTVQKNFVLNADGSGAAFAPEYDSSNNYAPVHFLTFGYAGNTAPMVAPNAITTANVAVGTEWTLDLADVFTDADGDTLTYTATVNDVAQTLTGSVLTYAPAAAGTYTVVLTASDNTGTATHTITVSCPGRNYVYDSFTLGGADQAKVSGGVLTKTIPLTASSANAWDGSTKTQPSQTNGVYQIGTGAELAWFAAQVNGGSYTIKGVLTADIDLAYYNWTPIGGTAAAKAFKGSFDGQNHTVNNLGIYYSATNTSAPYLGLFGYVNGTSSSYITIQNLKVNGQMFLTSTGSVANAYSGGVVAYANYVNISGVVSDVDITVTRVNGNWGSVGGVAGRLVNSNATNCGNEGTIHAYQYAGGITGYATGAITGCYNSGEITGNGYVGGIVGQTTKGVTACYNTGSITGAGNYVAGIVAYASGASASVKNCFNRAYVKSTGSNVGAVVGMTNNASAAMSNLYYLDFTCSQGIGSAKSTAQTATAVSKDTMASADFVTSMNTGLTTAAFGSSRYSPALTWQTDLIGLTTPSVGNVNLDPFGYVDEEDLALLTKWVAASMSSNNLTAEQWAQADINGDGILDRTDATLLRRYVNNPSKYPLR